MEENAFTEQEYARNFLPKQIIETNLVHPESTRAVSAVVAAAQVVNVEVLGANVTNVLLELVHLGSGVLDAREHVRQERKEQRNVFRNEFRHHRLADGLNQDLNAKRRQT